MVSAIDPSVPVAGTPTTASVRANFQSAHDEISALQVAGPYAPLASPALTGNPTAPTPAPGDSDTSIATTAFVANATAMQSQAAYTNVGRNLIHNPLFNVAQRGAGPFTTNAVYTADRWEMSVVTDALNISLNAMGDAGRTAVGDEAARTYLAISVTGSAAVGAYSQVFQPIEGVQRLGGKTVTVSFWAFGANGVTKLGVGMSQSFGTGGSPSAGVTVAGQAVTVTGSWARHSVTFAVPTTIGKTLGTNGNDSTALSFWFSASATYNANSGTLGAQTGNAGIWGVQLEVGSVATPLAKPDPRYDLANCRRFYSVGQMQLNAYNTAGGTCAYIGALAEWMRASPTLTPTGTGGLNYTAFAFTPLNPGQWMLSFNASATGSAAWVGSYTASADF